MLSCKFINLAKEHYINFGKHIPNQNPKRGFDCGSSISLGDIRAIEKVMIQEKRAGAFVNAVSAPQNNLN